MTPILIAIALLLFADRADNKPGMYIIQFLAMIFLVEGMFKYMGIL